MSRMELFNPDSPAYARAFKSLLHCTDERIYTKQLLADLFSTFPYNAVAVDWGAGNGSLTQELELWFRTVYAVEPNLELRNGLSERCPKAIIVPSRIEEATLPRSVDVGVMSHLLYSLPDDHWGEVCLKAASHLSQGGLLVVILKHFEAASSHMYEAFGAPRCSLHRVLDELEHRLEYDVTFRSTPGRYRTSTFEETLTIARCLMSDRPREAYTKLPTESEFREYVRTHFWNELTQQGGWNCPQQFALIHRNPFYSPRPGQQTDQNTSKPVVSDDLAGTCSTIPRSANNLPLFHKKPVLSYASVPR